MMWVKETATLDMLTVAATCPIVCATATCRKKKKLNWVLLKQPFLTWNSLTWSQHLTTKNALLYSILSSNFPNSVSRFLTFPNLGVKMKVFKNCPQTVKRNCYIVQIHYMSMILTNFHMIYSQVFQFTITSWSFLCPHAIS